MLTLLKGGDSQSSAGLVPVPPPEGSWNERPRVSALAHRPGDHFEQWNFEAVGTIRSLRNEARARGINPNTAITIVCERRLAYAELEFLGPLSTVLAAVEKAAEAPQAPLTMWAANRAYLRHLRDGDPLERACRTPLGSPQAAVPIRLLERLNEREFLAAPLGQDELAEALGWEIAALCVGKLIGEWANSVALAALDHQR